MVLTELQDLATNSERVVIKDLDLVMFQNSKINREFGSENGNTLLDIFSDIYGKINNNVIKINANTNDIATIKSDIAILQASNATNVTENIKHDIAILQASNIAVSDTANKALTLANSMIPTYHFPNSLFGATQDGYYKFYGGMILQFGHWNGNPGKFNFPIAFPTLAISFVQSNQDGSGNWADHSVGYIVNNSQYYLGYSRGSGDWNGGSSGSCNWIAIGY